MRKLAAILRRELAALFFSPVAYVTVVVFTAVSAWTFLQVVKEHIGEEEPLVTLLLVSILIWVPILITVICMRLFAEEKRSGTIETLMTAPVTELEVVFGKYFSALLFAVVSMVPAVANIYWLSLISPSIESVDIYALIGGCVILLLIIACCVSIGLVVSLLTRNQIVAAISCIAAICFPLFMKPLAVAIPIIPDSVVDYISIESHIIGFASGNLSLQVAVLYLSVAVLMLFASVRILESRRWL